MSKQTVARIALILIWIATLINIILTPISIWYLPVNVLKHLPTGSLYFCQQALMTLYVGALAVTSYLIWTNSRHALKGMIFTLKLFALSVLILHFEYLYVGMGSFEDVSLLTLGFLFVYIRSEIFHKTYDVTDLRIYIIASVSMMAAFCVYSAYDHSYKIYEFLPIDFTQSDVFSSIICLSFITSLLMLCFKSKVAKYLLPACLILILLDHPLAVNVLNPSGVLLDRTNSYITGIILGLLYFPDFSQEFKISSFSNSILLMFQSFYSQAAYKKVAYEKKGYGVLYLLVLLVGIIFSQVYLSYERTGLPEVASRVIHSKGSIAMLNFNNGELSINKKSPYTLYDQANKAVVIYDSTGAYKSLADVPPSVKVLETPSQIFVKDRNGTIFYRFSNEPKRLDQVAMVLAIAFRQIMQITLIVSFFAICYLALTIWLSKFSKYLRDYDFKTRMRLSMFSRIPVITILIFGTLWLSAPSGILMLLICESIVVWIRSIFLKSLQADRMVTY